MAVGVLVLARVTALAMCLLAATGSSSASQVVRSADQIRQFTLGPAAAVIGGADGRGIADLRRIRQVVPLRGDSILVSDIGIARVMLFDGNGAFQRMWASEGNAPNEFRAVHRIGLRGDSVWVSDGVTRRRKYFSVDGVLLLNQQLPSLAMPAHRIQGLGLVLTDGFLPGGRVVAFRPDGDRGRVTSAGASGTLAIFDSASAVVRSLSTFNRPLEYLQLRVNGVVHQMVPNQFQHSPLWTVSDDGLTIAFVQRTAPVDTAAASYKVWSWDANGVELFSTEITYAPLRIPGALVDSLVGYYASQMRFNDPTVQNAEGLARDSLAAPANYPAVTNIVVARGGEIWIAREGISGRVGALATNYDILSASGQLTGRLVLPRPARVIAATESSVWIAEYDMNDVPALRRFPIIR
jgi:hypothetical protein